MEKIVLKFKNWWNRLITTTKKISKRELALEKGNLLESLLESKLLDQNISKDNKKIILNDYKVLMSSMEYLKIPIYLNLEDDRINYEIDKIKFIYSKYYDN